jgi:hypothetical protein
MACFHIHAPKNAFPNQAAGRESLKNKLLVLA